MNNALQTPDFAPEPDEACFCASGQTFGQCCGRMTSDRPPPHGAILKSGWLAPERCDELVSRLERQSRGWLTIVDKKTGQERLDPMRVTERVTLGEMRTEVTDLVKEAFVEVAEPEMQCRVDWFISPNILRYSAGGQFSGHADAEVLDRQTGLWKRIIDRDLSILLYLNEDFTGGNITFMKFNYSYRPRKGDLLIFPSDQRYAHRAEPVASGVRYSVVSWAALTGGVRVQPAKPERAVSLR